MKVTIHQPDLLPYSGFWFKMATSDAFIVSKHDQFQKHGYQRRVTMRDRWCSHMLEGKPSLVPITDVVVREGWQQRLVDTISGRYRGAPLWKQRGADLCERILAAEGTRLDEVNLSLIYLIRELLGLTTPILFTDPPQAHARDRLIEQVQAVGGDEYLAGAGGRAYMGEDPEGYFADHGITLTWSDHEHITGDSVVSLLMDLEDPMPAILRRAGDQQRL
ncbi:WbqC family protein [Kocuria sp. HSID16901]|uniref:WbqC family protein n=1 Tax=Kocuria sp. HSID16901 TaxID=2419505 RepID=UPI000660D782|nr:WbqC family protein [Kocuria sp. HSID16901]MCT1366994.1 WbqC family protein [Rothia sp. p3-SID1597]RUQ19877.1 hypothetical protein D8M21_10620 [Kocuria sp. HSID16901]